MDKFTFDPFLSFTGCYFWPKNEAYKSISIFYSNFKEEECHNFEIQHKKLSNEIELVRNVYFMLTFCLLQYDFCFNVDI